MTFLTLFFLGIGVVMAQTQVRGTVVDDKGEPVIGASVQLKSDKTKGASTDIDGNFTLSVPNNAVLVVSSIGMVSQEVTAKPVMKITLKSDTKILDDVVVVAYGTAKKSSLTGASTSVDKKQLEMRPVSNLSNALSGVAPGVQTTTANGQPGSSVGIRIRGFGSINASSSPLYIVDGAPYDGNISDLNPADIENMTILKDAASTAIYGSSAGNGVVLITTKKGRAESKPTIQLSMSLGTSERAIPEYERVGVMDYYPVIWKQLYNREIYKNGKTPTEAGELASKNVFDELKYNPFKGVEGSKIVGIDGKLNPQATTLLYGDDLDWEKAMTRKALRQEYNLTLNQQSEKSDSYASIGYVKDNGYVIKSDFERFSGRVNGNYSPTSWLKTGLNISAFRTKSNSVNNGGDYETSYVNPFYFSRFMGPIYPVYLHDEVTGEYILDASGNKIYDYEKARGSGASSGRHVIAENLYNNILNERDGINTRTYLDFTLREGLKFTTNLSYDNTNSSSSSYMNRIVGDSKDKGSLNKVNIRTTTYNFNQLLNYQKSFNNIHNIEVLLGHENYYFQYQYHSSTKGKQILDDLYEYGNFITPEDLSSSTDNYRKEGYFTRLKYNYSNKYMAEFSYRKDGSSRFEKSSRWGDFWATGLSWRIIEEDFMKPATWVDDLKLRASYGLTGNDALDTYYAYQTLYAIGWNNYDNPGILFSRLGNPNLLWETQISSDIALEFGFFKRLKGTIEFFNKESKDLLFGLPLAVSTGNTSIDANVGKVRNTGVELDLNYNVIKTKDFNWSIAFNATHLKNKIVKLPEDRKEIISGTKKLMEGRSINDFWLRQYKGVDPKDGMPLYVFDSKNTYDSKTERIVNGDTLTVSQSKAQYGYNGSSIPTLYGGFNTTMSYKNFDLFASFGYQIGGKVYDGTYASLMAMDGMGRAIHVDAMNKSWQKEGDITDVPRLDAGESTNINASSDRWLTSGTSLMMKNLTLGYRIPKTLLNRFEITNARLTLSGENLFLISARKGLNPMFSYSGTTSNVYSAARTYSVGLQLTF